MAPERKEPKPNISFLISTPENHGDQQSLAILQYQARAHAARIAHLPSHKAKIALDTRPPRKRIRQKQAQPSSQEDSSPSSQCERVGREPSGEIIDVDDIEIAALSKIGRPRQRDDDYFFNNIRWHMPAMRSVDPLYFLPYQRHSGVYLALGHYVNVSTPSARPVYEIFDITSTHTSLLLDYIMLSEAFYHSAIARLLITANDSYGVPGPGPLDGAMITYHQTTAMKHLRKEIETNEMPSDSVLLTILFLITIDVCALSLQIYHPFLTDFVIDQTFAGGDWPAFLLGHP